MRSASLQLRRRKISPRPIIIFGALLLSGCTAHYRQSLRDYERGHASSFYEQTLEWAARAEGETSATLAQPPLDLAALRLDAEAAEPDATFLRLLSELLAEEPQALARQLEPLRDTDRLDRQLADTLSWPTLRLAVALGNPRARAAREEWQATLHQYDQAEFLEGLVGQFSAFTRYLEIDTGAAPGQPMTREFFPFPGAIAYKGQMLRQMARQAELAWQLALRESMVEAGEEFYEYQYLVRAAATVQENIELLEDLAAVMEQRYRSGLITQSQLLRVHNQLDEERNRLRDLEVCCRLASQSRINALLGRDIDAALGLPADEDLAPWPDDFETLRRLALERNQEILVQRAGLELMSAAIRMGEIMSRPPGAAAAAAFERGMMPEAGADRMAPSGLDPRPDAPGPAFAQAEAYLAESRRRLRADQLRLEDLERQTAATARAAFENLDIVRRRVVLLEQSILPRLETIHELSLTDFASDRIDFEELFGVESDLFANRLEAHEARRDLNLEIIRLARTAGRLPAQD